jgi:ParB-like nuclease domain
MSTEPPFTPHPVAAKYPPLPDDEMQALTSSIDRRGLNNKIIYRPLNGGFEVIDGIHRYKALKALNKVLMSGAAPNPKYFEKKAFADEAAIEAFILDQNAHRRHLTREDWSRRIAAAIEANPTLSDRQIAKDLGTNHMAVNRTRNKDAANGTLLHKTDRVEAGGRKARGVKPGTAKKWKSHRDPGEAEHRAMLVKKYATNRDLGCKPFTSHMADLYLNLAVKYVHGLLKKMAAEGPVEGFVLTRIGPDAGPDTKWRFVLKTGAQSSEEGPCPDAVSAPATPEIGGSVPEGGDDLDAVIIDAVEPVIDVVPEEGDETAIDPRATGHVKPYEFSERGVVGAMLFALAQCREDIAKMLTGNKAADSVLDRLATLEKDYRKCFEAADDEKPEDKEDK